MDRWTSGFQYEQWMGRWSRLLAVEFLQWLNMASGLRWLDVCCGTGIVSETIADHAAPATVVGIDQSPQQIEFARQNRSHPNITFETGDAMSMQLPDSSFDIVVCGLGLNFIPDPTRAVKEFGRVLLPGGTVAAFVWDYAEGARFLREFWDAAIAVDPEAAALDQARRFTICTRDGLRVPFDQAKLESITIHALEIETRFANFEDYWDPLLTGQGSAPAYMATRDEKTRAAIRARLRATLPANARGEIILPARAWAVRARRPVV